MRNTFIDNKKNSILFIIVNISVFVPGKVYLLLCSDKPEDAVREHNVSQDGETVLQGGTHLIRLVVHSGLHQNTRLIKIFKSGIKFELFPKKNYLKGIESLTQTLIF